MKKWGGRRDGAGRPKGSVSKDGYRAKRHNLYCSDEEWQMLMTAAEERGISMSEWIRRAVWRTDKATGESVGLIDLRW
jgi:hypothetical protein